MGGHNSGRKAEKEIKQFFLDYALLKGRLIKLQSEKRVLTTKGLVSADNIEHLVDIDMEIRDIYLTILEADQVIDSLDVRRKDKAYSLILRKFYIEGDSLLDISEQLRCSLDNVNKLKAQALYNLTVVLTGPSAVESTHLKDLRKVE